MFFAAALPMQQAEVLQPANRIDGGAAAAAGLDGDGVIGRVEPAGSEIQKIKCDRVEDRQRSAANDAAVSPRSPGLAVPFAGGVPALGGLLAAGRHEADGAGDGIAPDRPGRWSLGAGKVRQGGNDGGY